MGLLKIKNSGFTLVELLVTVMIFGLISTALVGIFLNSIRAGSKADAIAEVKESGDYALGVIERRLRNAERVTCGASRIEYVLPGDSPSDDPHYFELSGAQHEQYRQIIFEDGALTSRSLTVEPLSFVCGTDNKTVTISFTITKGYRSEVRDFAQVSFRSIIRVREY